MRSTTSLRAFFFAALCSNALADWSFTSGKAAVTRRGDTEAGTTVTFDSSKPLSSPISLSTKDTLKLAFTLTDDGSPARPHQAFLLLRDPSTNLETFYPLTVKPSSGKAAATITHKDISPHLLTSPSLSLSLVLGGFGDGAGSVSELGTITPVVEAVAQPGLEKTLEKERATIIRYEPKRELRHTFRADPQNPPIAITLAFAGAVLGALLVLVGAWFGVLGANFGHLGKATKTAPVSHLLFFGSLVAMEAVFGLYYACWNLFTTLPAAAAVGAVAFFTGSRALTEVSLRRERGER